MTARTNDLECWKLFCLVVEKQGLNAAADFADIEPSRLSRVINSLEAELGSPLLVHNRRPLQTTSFGDQAYAMAKALLAQHALMLETLKDDKDRMEGLITLAIPAGIGPLFVTPQILEFQQIFPKIEFELITLTSKAEEVFYNHPEKVVHVSIGYGVPGTGDIVSRYSGKMEFIPCCSPNYIKKHGHIVDPSECAVHTGLSYTGGTRTKTQELQNGGVVKQLKWKKSLSFQSLSDLKNACLLGAGIAGDIPLIHCIDELEEGKLVNVLRGWKRPAAGCYLYSTKHFVEYRRVKTFLDWMAEKHREILEQIDNRFGQLA